MNNKETHNPVIIIPQTPKKSFFTFSWCMSPDMSTVVAPIDTAVTPKNNIKKESDHAIGRRIPQSIDNATGFGF